MTQTKTIADAGSIPAVSTTIKMITLTEFAAEKIKKLLDGRKETGVRAGVSGGGCSGFTYKLDFDVERDKDRIVESHGVSIYIDTKSYLYLMGTQIDYVDELTQSGFKFVNHEIMS